MKLDLNRYFYGFRFHLANGSLKDGIMRKLHLTNHQKFDSSAFASGIIRLLEECRYVDAYQYIKDTLCALDDKCPNNYRVWKYILQGDSEQAIHLINQMIKRIGHGEHRDAALVFRYGILGGDYVETDCVKQNPYFANMLCNKRIALVGPANDPDFDLETISKSHDVIAIFNYSQKGSIEQYKVNSNCKVVSYYSGYSFVKILDLAGDNQAIFNEPDGIVLKNPGDIYRLNKDLCNSERIRCKLGMDWLIYYASSLNMIQLAAFDLLQFNPQAIDIYGCNFHLTENRYRADYIGNSLVMDNRELIKLMAMHNQLVQYQILFYLYKYKRINPDNMLKEILDLGVEGFCAEMERFYLPRISEEKEKMDSAKPNI